MCIFYQPVAYKYDPYTGGMWMKVKGFYLIFTERKNATHTSKKVVIAGHLHYEFFKVVFVVFRTLYSLKSISITVKALHKKHAKCIELD
jgi:hypothetical protein